MRARGTTDRRGSRFYGWRVVAAAAAGLFVGYGPIVSSIFGVFLKPLVAEFGWTRGEVSLAFSISLLALGLLGLQFLWIGVSGETAFLGALLAGLGMGVEVDVIAYMVSPYFGLRAFGEIYGYAFTSCALGVVVGPLVMGAVFDAAGSYRPALAGFLVVTVVATLLIARMGPYRSAGRAGDRVPLAAASSPRARDSQGANT